MWRAEYCRNPEVLPFKLSYGNLSSFPPHDGSRMFAPFFHSGCGILGTILPGVILFNTLILRYFPLYRNIPFGITDWNSVFSVQYSVHKTTSVPQQSPDGKWDCSVPLWSSFSHHFPCDLQPQCRNNEDEAHCFYNTHTTHECPPGFVTIPVGRCYAMLETHEIHTWVEASDKCAEMSGRLVTLKTPEEAEALLGLLSVKMVGPEVYVGLRTAGDDLLSAPLSYM